MGNSPSVENAAARSTEAQEALTEFANQNTQKAMAYQKEFRVKVDAELLRAGITDQTFPITDGIEQQVEFASEFNVDGITAVVSASLNQLAAVTSGPAGATLATATSPTAFKSYVQVVEAIGASLKSSSSTSGAYTFQITKIGPGIFAFISATSANLTDTKLFGSEVVSSASFVFTFARSLQDIENTNGYEAAANASAATIILQTNTLIYSARVASESIIQLKVAQGDLITALINQSITLEEYDTLDEIFELKLEDWIGRQTNRAAATNLVQQMHITQDLDSTHLRKIKNALVSPSLRAACDNKKMDHLEKCMCKVQARVNAATLSKYITLIPNYSLAFKCQAFGNE